MSSTIPSRSRTKPAGQRQKPSPRNTHPLAHPSELVLSRDEVISRSNPDRTVTIMRFDDDEHFFVLDGIAAELWSMIDGKRSLERIKDALIQKHRPPRERFARDVANLIRSLMREQLVRKL